MKTVNDILELIKEQNEKNEGKVLQYLFVIDLRYNWLSLYTKNAYNDEIEELFSSSSIKTESFIQESYWKAYNATRND